MPNSVMCVTGHRPDKLWGYDMKHVKYNSLKKVLMQILIENECEEAITGMALGVDTVFALAVLELKELGYNIKLHCAIPCQNQASKWNKESRELYNKILLKADIRHVVTPNKPYETWMLQKRNEYMVDLSQCVVAVWDGSSGGTGNCVKYAKKKNKDIIEINPKKI